MDEQLCWTCGRKSMHDCLIDTVDLLSNDFMMDGSFVTSCSDYTPESPETALESFSDAFKDELEGL